MFNNLDKDNENYQDNPFDTDILEQGFSQLPIEGKIHLKKYLHSLVSIQSVMATVFPSDTDNTRSSSKN